LAKHDSGISLSGMNGLNRTGGNGPAHQFLTFPLYVELYAPQGSAMTLR
jgi:hypothetical protein